MASTDNERKMNIVWDEQKYEEWMQDQIAQEGNRRRRELLEKGLGHGTIEFSSFGMVPRRWEF